MSKKKILLVSTTRADYGLIKRLLFLFKKDLSFMTKFLVSSQCENKGQV